MVMIDLSSLTHGGIFMMIQDTIIHYFVNFSNLSRKNPLWLVFTGPQYYTPSILASSSVLILLSQLSENKVSFDEILTHHLLGSMILFMQAAAPTIYCWNSNAFIASFPFLIYGYIIFINLDHTRFFNSSHNVSILLNINK